MENEGHVRWFPALFSLCKWIGGRMILGGHGRVRWRAVMFNPSASLQHIGWKYFTNVSFNEEQINRVIDTANRESKMINISDFAINIRTWYLCKIIFFIDLILFYSSQLEKQHKSVCKFIRSLPSVPVNYETKTAKSTHNASNILKVTVQIRL